MGSLLIPEEVLLTEARSARSCAFVPYSQFRVGAAVITSDGDVVSGCNVENASYGLTICAERVAIFSAVARGARKIAALAVTTDASTEGVQGDKMPCGACRQVMSQFMDPDAVIIVDGLGRFQLRDLLPHPFRLPK
jgi:cytidine deaminase